MAKETLVVVSKVKKFIKEKSGNNTAADTIDALSQAVEALCERAIEAAQAGGRKTVMARDVKSDHL